MSKKAAIVQSNYIPWKGYFDLINMADQFILLDDVQYTKGDWRNRNKIKTPDGVQWLTIPVCTKRRYLQRINETEIADPEWNRKHWRRIVLNYRNAEYFSDYEEFFEELYLGSSERLLSEINYRFLSAICEVLGINTRLLWSTDYDTVEGRSERLVNLCQQTESTEYISGPSAQAYIHEQLFESPGIRLTYIDYSGYPEYKQLYPPFEHKVSIIDLILNTGPDASKYMQSWG